MKRYTLVLILFVLFSACKKDKQQQQSQLTDKGYPVSFSVSGFSSVIVPINNNSKIKLNDVNTPPFKYLYYKLYKTSATASFHSIVQGVLAPNVGHFNDTIPPGQYTVSIIGANLPLTFTKPTDTAFHVGSNVSVPDRDLFFKKYALNVTGNLSPQNITLDRIVAQVEVNIEDAIPVGISSVSLSYKDLYFFSIIRNAAPFYSAASPVDGISGVNDILGTVTQTITTSDVGTTNYKIRGFIDDTVNPVTITIKAGGITRVIPNIKFTKNTKTILTGKLFSGTASSFNISYNPVYSDTLKVGL